MYLSVTRTLVIELPLNTETLVLYYETIVSTMLSIEGHSSYGENTG